jgi:PqqD family protein of HPr-rel-A system
LGLLLRSTERILRVRRWGDESVIFDTYSGETHYLNALASAIFDGVSASGSIDLESLCAALACGDDLSAEPQIPPEEIGGAAARLRDIGLIRVDDDGT